MQSPPGVMSLLLGDTPEELFFERFYLKLPFARREGCRPLRELGNWDTLDALLHQTDVDIIVGRMGNQHVGDLPRSLETAQELLSEGYTVGIRKAHRIHEGLRQLAQQFCAAFQRTVDIHLYCTPAEHPGFGWHYDAEEVFVLQTIGEKDWYFRKNTVNPWPVIDSIPHNQKYEREISPIQHCRLSAGDWLYLPSGYWHRTSAVTESISLSVGVQALNGVDYYDFLRPHLMNSILWRQRLPALATAARQNPETLKENYRVIIEQLAQDLAGVMTHDYILQAFLESQRHEKRTVTNDHQEIEVLECSDTSEKNTCLD